MGIDTLNRHELREPLLGLRRGEEVGRPGQVTPRYQDQHAHSVRSGRGSPHSERLSPPLLLTAASEGGDLLGDGFPAALGRARPHVELVLGGGTEVRQVPAGLGRGGNVDVNEFPDLVGVVY